MTPASPNKILTPRRGGSRLPISADPRPWPATPEMQRRALGRLSTALEATWGWRGRTREPRG
jgi:hypothetical protein